MSKALSDLTEYTDQPAATDLLLLRRTDAGVDRVISFLNLLKKWWVEKTAAYTAAAGDKILANTTSDPFTLTLPPSPSAKDTVEVWDGYLQWDTNNLTIGRNGANIKGAASNVTLNTQGQKLTFVYIDSTIGWNYY